MIHNYIYIYNCIYNIEILDMRMVILFREILNDSHNENH